jgi:predicted Zn-dependent protease
MDFVTDLRRQGRYQEALQEAERLLEHSASPRLALERANLLARLGRPQEALLQLETLPPAQLGDYGLALKAGLLEHTGALEESQSLFEDLAQRPHLSPVAWRRVMQYLQKQDPERAAHWAQRHSGEGAEGLQLQAQGLIKAGQTEAALELLQRSLESFPAHPGLMRDFVMLRLHDESPEVVVEELDTLLSMQEHTRNVALRERLVQALRETQQWERARQELLECLRWGGNQHYLRANLAYVLRDMGSLEEALDLMEELLLENPADVHVLGAYFKACREHGAKERAGAFVAEQARQDPRKRRWWGTFKKVFKS